MAAGVRIAVEIGRKSVFLRARTAKFSAGVENIKVNYVPSLIITT